jgi:hypothetical protein
MAKEQIGSNATFSGPQKGLTTIGDHCYAYSGIYSATTTSTSRLLFTTGKYYVIGKMRLSGNIDTGDALYGNISTMIVKFNGVEVLVSKTDGGNEQMPTSDNAPMIIPPLTTVECISDASATEANFKASISFVGRVYHNI